MNMQQMQYAAFKADFVAKYDASFDEAKHPRAPAGGQGGGQFTAGQASGAAHEASQATGQGAWNEHSRRAAEAGAKASTPEEHDTASQLHRAAANAHNAAADTDSQPDWKKHSKAYSLHDDAQHAHWNAAHGRPHNEGMHWLGKEPTAEATANAEANRGIKLDDTQYKRDLAAGKHKKWWESKAGSGLETIDPDGEHAPMGKEHGTRPNENDDLNWFE